jgi:transposase
LKRRKYNATFKKEVLKVVSTSRPVYEVAQSSGIGENLIYKGKSRDTHTTNQHKKAKE